MRKRGFWSEAFLFELWIGFGFRRWTFLLRGILIRIFYIITKVLHVFIRLIKILYENPLFLIIFVLGFQFFLYFFIDFFIIFDHLLKLLLFVALCLFNFFNFLVLQSLFKSFLTKIINVTICPLFQSIQQLLFNVAVKPSCDQGLILSPSFPSFNFPL